ncbi:MAG: UDP-3-O-acyl-N-acetylglucosamine deacetylase [bacterium]|nr:UDP-3-O-acyl-N-acetylglucosamine deacetylase [bacterium]
MQQTIKKELEYSGIGLHTGEQIHLVFKPATAGTGIVFVRQDLSGKPMIKACPENVNNTWRELSLKKNGVEIHTVEHLLAALSGLGIDNIEIAVNGDEIPIGDGSALPFVELLKDEIISRNTSKKVFRPKEPLWAGSSTEDKQVILLPSDEWRITYTIDFEHPVVKTQLATFVITQEVFVKEIAPARTFGFLKEVESLHARGLAKGGSLENAIVIGEDKILNDSLRFENELVRHKILDLIGDFSLIGMPILGHVIAIKSGHDLNLKLVQKMATCAIDIY